MATITRKGLTVHTSGNLPAVGSTAPAFKLTAVDLSDVGLDAFAGKKKLMNIVPSLDTGICAMSARRFNSEVAKLDDAVLLNISADLPFAQKRFCESEKLHNIVTLSTMHPTTFGTDYGVVMIDGPLAGILSRAVLVLDQNNRVIHAQQVPEIAQEPDYESALAALRSK